MVEHWKGVFKLQMSEVESIYPWLDAKWSQTNPCTFRLGHAARIIVEGKMRDDIFKVCEWIRHQNPLGKKLSYSVIGYNDTTINYLSYCQKCRKGEGRHDEHS